MSEVRLAIEGDNGIVRLSPSMLINNKLSADPQDLRTLVPTGTGLYGLQEHPNNPIVNAPIHEPTGGTIYFDNDLKLEDLLAVARVMGIKDAKTSRDFKQYAAFLSESTDPKTDGFLHQMRLIHRFGMEYLFGAIDSLGYDDFPQQDLSIPEAMWEFVQYERKMWGTDFWDSPKLAGKFGGDSNYAREQLSFGLMVENDYYGVYRIWSRAWLVTK